MKTNAQVKKWGNSLAIRIPNSVAKDLGLVEDSAVQIASNGSSATIKLLKYKGMSLEEMLEGITPENIHGELDRSLPVGKEVW